ncbi:hypothetical protein D3C80_1971850 [compost metagenome]
MEGHDLATAVRLQRRLVRQKGAKGGHVAGPRRFEEGAGDAFALLRLHGVAGPGLPDMAAGATGQLPHRSGIALQGRRHLVEADIEHVMKKEGGAFQGR